MSARTEEAGIKYVDDKTAERIADRLRAFCANPGKCDWCGTQVEDRRMAWDWYVCHPCFKGIER